MMNSLQSKVNEMNINIIDYQQLKADQELNPNCQFHNSYLQELKLNKFNWDLVDLLINGNVIDNTITNTTVGYTEQ